MADAKPDDVTGGRSAAERLARWRVPAGFIAAPVALWLARPTWMTLAGGGLVALAGQAVRLWAAGHLEKDREVTASGPYRWTRHPLYVGSSLMGAGLALASARLSVAVIVLAYLAVTMTAAIRLEEARLSGRFGEAWAAYASGRPSAGTRRFSLRRALGTNREHRSMAGMAIVFALMAWSTWCR